MQYILTQQELDSLTEEVKKEAKTYLEQYRTWVFTRCEAAIKHTISLSSRRFGEGVDPRLIREFLHDYDAKNPEPMKPKALQ